MALWMLKPDQVEGLSGGDDRRGVFMVTFVTFFFAEMGDKTQIATVTLAAAYPNLVAVVAGTTLGMLLANAPVVFFGKAFASRLPVKALNIAAAILFLAVGAAFLVSAMTPGAAPPP